MITGVTCENIVTNCVANIEKQHEENCLVESKNIASPESYEKSSFLPEYGRSSYEKDDDDQGFSDKVTKSQQVRVIREVRPNVS